MSASRVLRFTYEQVDLLWRPVSPLSLLRPQFHGDLSLILVVGESWCARKRRIR
jgi:hypothetical protein